jgi:hypothetical protein
VKWFNAMTAGICCTALVARIYDVARTGGDRQQHVHGIEKKADLLL